MQHIGIIENQESASLYYLTLFLNINLYIIKSKRSEISSGTIKPEYTNLTR